MVTSVDTPAAQPSSPTQADAGWSDVLRPALRVLLVMTILTGVIYPLLVLCISQAIFPDKANGSIIEINGNARGSALVGQSFIGQPGYFWGRPSAAGADDGYDSSLSSGSNLGPTSSALLERVTALATFYQSEHPERGAAPVPVDLVTASGSGLDPHITPAAAEYQVLRVARERRISEDIVRSLVEQHTDGRTFGVLGEPQVNVLLLNIALDALADTQ